MSAANNGSQRPTSAMLSANSPNADADTGPLKRKRNRITLSCTECHRRKQQCDRGNPCSRCVKRGMPEACVMELPSRAPYPLPAGNARGKRRAGQATTGILDLSHGYAGPVEGENQGTPSAALTSQHGPQSYFGVGTVADFLNKIGFPGSESSPHVGGVYPSLPRGSEVDHSGRPDMRPSFPPRRVTDYLIEHFFGQSGINWLYDCVHRPTFERDYEAFWVQNEPDSLDFVALLAVMCASSLQLLSDSDAEELLSDISGNFGPDRDAFRAKLFNLARMQLATSEHEQNPTLERIQAMLLIAVYSKNEGSATDNYSITGAAIRVAQSMGMHRDGESKWGMRPLEAELRRRLWWALYDYDRNANFALGRPYVIHDQHCDVRLPLNIDDEDLVDADGLFGKPLDQPTTSSFRIIQTHFARLVGQISDQCFGVNAPTYRMVLDLDTALHDFERTLPSAYRSQSVAEALERPYIAYQTQILMIQIQSVRITLHRPFLLRDPPEEDLDLEDEQNVIRTAEFFRSSRAACILTCKKLLSAQHLLQSSVTKPQLRWFLLAFRTFDPATTLCAAILHNPEDPQAEELDKWVLLGRDLLWNMGKENVVALEGVRALDILRTRCMAARNLPPPPNAAYGDVLNVPFLRASVSIKTNGHAAGSDGPSNHFEGVAPPMHLLPESNPLLDMPTTFVNALGAPLPNYEWAARVLGEPQFTISDMLGPLNVGDPMWSDTLIENVFDAHFPSGIDVLGGNMDVLTNLM